MTGPDAGPPDEVPPPAGAGASDLHLDPWTALDAYLGASIEWQDMLREIRELREVLRQMKHDREEFLHKMNRDDAERRAILMALTRLEAILRPGFRL